MTTLTATSLTATSLTTGVGSLPKAGKAPLWRRLLVGLQALDQLARERDDMAQLDARLLRDMGLTRADIADALSRPEDHLRSILARGGDEI